MAKDMCSPPAWVEIDLKKLDYNFSVLKNLPSARNKKIVAVVKADAYGHGALEISRRALANGAYGLGVARAGEGADLRNQGIECPIYILGDVDQQEADTALEYGLTPSISSLEGARLINSRAKTSGKKIGCHINVDTGMNRLGINYACLAPALKEIQKLHFLKIEGMFTHFACASDQTSSLNRKQMHRFGQAALEAKQILGPMALVHCANSAAHVGNLPLEANMVRLGIAMYGLNPFNGPCSVKLLPLLSLKAKAVLVKKVAKGETISYCGRYRVEKESRIATFAVGYADGYTRLLSNQARIIIGGDYAPVAGNITMDMFMADVTHIQGVSAGDVATLIGEVNGKSVTAGQLAEIIGTINYEVVCMIRARLPKIFIR